MTDFQFRHIALSVGDLAKQREFYASALGFVEEVASLELAEIKARLFILRNHAGVELNSSNARNQLHHCVLDWVRLPVGRGTFLGH